MGARCHRPISAGGPKAFTVSDLQRGDQEGVIAEAFRPQEIHQPRLLPVERLDHVASSARHGYEGGLYCSSPSCGTMGESGLPLEITRCRLR